MAQRRLAVAGPGHAWPPEHLQCPLDSCHDRDLVFSMDNGEYLHPERFSRGLTRAIIRYNKAHPQAPLPHITLHGLRHGASTHAGAEGFSEAARMDRLGQRSAAVNTTYTHATDANRVRLANNRGEQILGNP